MILRGKKLVALVSGPPAAPGFRHAAALARSALAGGLEVYLYCIDDAVAGVDDPRLQQLIPAGLKLFACADSARRRRLPISAGAVYSGLALLSSLVAAADRFVAFP